MGKTEKTAKLNKPLCACCTCDPCNCPPKAEKKVGCCGDKKVEAPKKGGCCGDKKTEAPKKSGCCGDKKVEAPKKGGCCDDEKINVLKKSCGDKKKVKAQDIPEITIAIGGKNISIKIEDLM